MSFDFTDDSVGNVPAPGKYTVTAAKAEVKTSQNGGDYIKVEFDLKGGGKIWENFSLKHPVGRSRLKAFIVASGGQVKFTDVTQLEGLSCQATVKNKEDDYGLKASISSFQKAKDEPAANPFA